MHLDHTVVVTTTDDEGSVSVLYTVHRGSSSKNLKVVVPFEVSRFVQHPEDPCLHFQDLSDYTRCFRKHVKHTCHPALN